MKKLLVLAVVLAMAVACSNDDNDLVLPDGNGNEQTDNDGNSDNEGDENGDNEGDENGEGEGDENGEGEGDENGEGEGDENGEGEGDENGEGEGDENGEGEGDENGEGEGDENGEGEGDDENTLVYGGVTYKTVTMKDGNVWMAENLRYVPEGMTPSDDLSAVTNGIWYPLLIDDITATPPTHKFSKDEADITANGYLYNTETALGLKTGDLTAENCKNYEGAQGICPEGWHIPTKADIVGLVGKTASNDDTNPAAPYYDAALGTGGGSIALLNADGFNADAWGAVNIANSTTATGTAIGAIKAYQEGMNTGYLAGSTIYDSGKNITTNEDGSLKNCQFVGFMANKQQGTFNGAWNNYRNGVSVRCVKNK